MQLHILNYTFQLLYFQESPAVMSEKSACSFPFPLVKALIHNHLWIVFLKLLYYLQIFISFNVLTHTVYTVNYFWRKFLANLVYDGSFCWLVKIKWLQKWAKFCSISKYCTVCFPYGWDPKIPVCLYNAIFIVSFCREEDNTNTAARSASHIVLHAGNWFSACFVFKHCKIVTFNKHFLMYAPVL